jgi:asparagine N-glycosylation enzyme membrane subunit Stt3
MRLNQRLTPVLLWLAIGCIAAFSCGIGKTFSHMGNEYFPFGIDSFYHAVRILDAVRDPASFYEFDAKIHAPEGSLLVWPWGYDYFMAKLVRGALAIGLGSDPLMTLLWIPVGAVFIGVGLLMLVARRVGLGNWGMALAGLCMALSSSTQLLYTFGQIDHHYAEHICILASLAAGLSWFKSPSNTSGIALGIIFGIALAIHNALFVIQVPFLATALVLWLQGKGPALRPAIAFAAALLIATLAILLPSQPFQEGRFEFYYLSWFHLYVVGCTAAVMVLLAWLPPTRRNIGALAVITALLVAPLINQIAYARSFVNGSLGMLSQILEMRSPLQMVRDGSFDGLTRFYSALFFLTPITFALCAIRLWRERSSPRLLFWVWCVFGLPLMMMQVRMHYFGTFALFLPWIIVAQEIGEKRPELHKRALLLTSLILLLAYAQVIRYQLMAPSPRAGDAGFAPLYPVFEPLRKACEQDPGVVLADANAGHYIRYFTKCSVIANNFLLTKQQFDKAFEVDRLFALPPEELPKQAPYVKYVLTRAGDIATKPNGEFQYRFFGRETPGLSQKLLLTPVDSVPPGYKLLYRVTMTKQQPNSDRTVEVPYARLYKVVPSAEASLAPASANDVSE